MDAVLIKCVYDSDHCIWAAKEQTERLYYQFTLSVNSTHSQI